MNIRHLLLALMLGSSLLTTGCLSEESVGVDQDRIFGEYELFYNANEDKTYARATFHFGNLTGTRLKLSSPSSITFNGDALNWNALLSYYEIAYAGQKTGSFVFTDTEGNVFTNAATLPSFTYANPPTTIDRSASTTLNWQTPLAPNENVGVAINGENEGDGKLFFTDVDGATSIILDQARLSGVGAGPGTIFLDLRRLPANLDATSAGAVLTERYRPKNLAVTFN